jgi:chitodextrinase
MFRYFPPSSSVVSVVASPDFLTLAPGASATVSLGVAALPTATTGSYVFTSASDGAGTFRSNSLGTGDAVVSGLTYQLGAPADTAAPTAPTGATARALGSGSVALAWSAASDNVGVFGYRVNRGGVLLTSIGTSLVDAGVAPATAYTYSIQAFDRQGNLSPAVTVSLTTPARTDFSPPTAPVVTAEAGDHSLSVSWSASSDNVGVAYYRIYPCLVPGCLVPADVRTFTVGGLPTRTKVNVQVLAVDGDDNPSSFSLGTYPVYTAAAGTIAPSQPRHLVSPAGSFGHVELSWAPSSDDRGVDHYAVYRNNRRIATVTTTSYTDTLVRCASEYYVQAVDADGSLSAPSDRVWFSPPPSPATDSSPPSAGLIAPADGSTVSGTIAVGAIASDDVGVTNAQLYVDGVFKGSSTSTPSSFTWDTTSVPDGVHWLYVRAYDAAGNYGTAGVAEVTVHNGGGADAALPKVSILAPTTGTVVPDSVAVSATASDSTGVTSVQFSVDGAPAAVATEAPYEFTWDASGSSQGSHTITATADDAAGNSASATVIVLRPVPSDPPAPAVSITAPTNGATVSGLIQVQASASDSVGVTGVELSVDGAVRGKRTVDPWSFSIDTTKLTNGSHAVAVTAYDAAGNSSSAQVTVSVQNAAADTTPPKAPSNLKASSIGTTQITLSWTASTDNVGVVGYDVYRDGTLIGQSLRPGSIDTGLSPATTHVYVVRARDAAGNTSAASSALTAKTNGLPSPSSLKAAVVGTTQVAFFWTPSTASAGIVGYDIYRDGVMIGRASLPNYLDSGLAPGTSHVYVVRARDAAGNRSAASSGLSTKTAAISASTTGTVAGVFYDQQGKPLANAVVQLTGNGVSKSSKTNGSGSYTFSFLTPGTYSIAIRPPGTFAAPLLTADSGSATVISGQTTVLVATDME